MFPTMIIVSHMKVNMNFHLNNNLDKTLTFIQPYTYDFDLHITKYMWYCLLLKLERFTYTIANISMFNIIPSPFLPFPHNNTQNKR